jgi:hypothetical protein
VIAPPASASPAGRVGRRRRVGVAADNDEDVKGNSWKRPGARDALPDEWSAVLGPARAPFSRALSR